MFRSILLRPNMDPCWVFRHNLRSWEINNIGRTWKIRYLQNVLCLSVYDCPAPGDCVSMLISSCHLQFKNLDSRFRRPRSGVRNPVVGNQDNPGGEIRAEEKSEKEWRKRGFVKEGMLILWGPGKRGWRGRVEEGRESKRAEGETDRKTETDKDKERQGETAGTRVSLSPFKGIPPVAQAFPSQANSLKDSTTSQSCCMLRIKT